MKSFPLMFQQRKILSIPYFLYRQLWKTLFISHTFLQKYIPIRGWMPYEFRFGRSIFHFPVTEVASVALVTEVPFP